MQAKKLPTKTEILDLIWDNPIEIGRWVGFNLLTDLHNQWLKSFLFGKKDQTLLAHRGSYKTTVLCLFLAIHLVIRPTETVMYFRKTDTDVAEVSRTVAKILNSGAMRRIVFILYGIELELTTANNSEINTNLNTNTSGVSQIVGLGIGTSITGKHADIVVTDDIVNLKDRVSSAERKLTRIRYQELENIKNRGGRFINLGTPWHKDDAISVMPNVTRIDCYASGLISPAELADLRSKMSPSLFAANYELRHIASEDAMFTSPHITDKEEEIYGCVGHIDAAYGGGDYTAYTLMRRVSPDRIVAFGKLYNKHVDDCLKNIAIYHRLYRGGSISCETNADKGYLAKELRESGYAVETYPERMNKYLKISTYLKKYWDQIYWLEGTDPEYLSQILDYTENAEHDDAPDSASSLLRSLDGRPKSHLNRVRGGI